MLQSKVLFNTLEEFDTKLLIKALIYLSFEQKKTIGELKQKLNSNAKQPCSISKHT